MQQSPHPIGQHTIPVRQWLLSTVATFILIPLLGCPVIMGLFLLTYDTFENSESNPLPLYVLMAFTVACLVAAGQWSCVRQLVSSPLSWVSGSGCAASIGLGIACFAMFALGTLEIMNTGLLWSLAGLGIGSGIGVCQWYMIHRRLQHGIWWMLMNVLVWQLWFAIIYWHECQTTPYHC